jgi:hypothetical protein
MSHQWVSVAENLERDSAIEQEVGLRSLRHAVQLLAVEIRTALERGDTVDAFQTSAGQWRVVAMRTGSGGALAIDDRSEPRVGSAALGLSRPLPQEGRTVPTSAAERRAWIVELLVEQRFVRCSSLSAMLGVSQMTVRRDLKRLEFEGLATRAYGGALARRHSGLRDRRSEGPPAMPPSASIAP